MVQTGLYNSTFTGNGVDVLKTTASTATISGNNTYTGGTTVSDGTLVVANVNALGTGGLTINSAAIAELQAGLAGPVQLPSLTIAGGAATNGSLYGDFDFSGIVDDATDYDLASAGLAHQGGAFSGNSSKVSEATGVQPVPEPDGIVLLLMGLFVATCVRQQIRYRLTNAVEAASMGAEVVRIASSSIG